MINLKDYQDKKKQSLVFSIKAGKDYAITTKKFNPDTGADLPDEVIGVKMIELIDKKKALQDEIAEIDAFIADCNALDTK